MALLEGARRAGRYWMTRSTRRLAERKEKELEDTRRKAHEDFTKRLTEKHPDLTVTEPRTCCYIKMGLSSKDIAPLFNISYRSVEMTRYRLRRKLNHDRSENLSDYLQKI